MKKVLVVMAILAMAATAQAEVILGWTFAVTPVASQVANTLNANLVSGGSYDALSRGAGAASAAGAGFRTQGFMNNGISTANTDYFQILLAASVGYELSLNSIDAGFVGTASFSTTPGVAHQWAYSLDGSTFSLIGVSQNRVGNGTDSFDFTGVSALQNVASGTDVYLRYYASGNTTTGGWGFQSANSLSVDGDVVAVPEPATMSLLGLGALAMVLRRKIRK